MPTSIIETVLDALAANKNIINRGNNLNGIP